MAKLPAEIKVSIKEFEDPRIKALFDALPEMLEMLKELQWVTAFVKAEPYCPCCFEFHGDGHKENCKLKNLLLKIEQ